MAENPVQFSINYGITCYKWSLQNFGLLLTDEWLDLESTSHNKIKDTDYKVAHYETFYSQQPWKELCVGYTNKLMKKILKNRNTFSSFQS